MTTHDLTLGEVRKSAKITERVHRVSDFLSKEQKVEIAEYREKKALEGGSRGFDNIDAYSAEIMARFGYEAWQAWQCGQIKAEKMLKLVLAERAREKQRLLPLEAIVISAVAGANNPTKAGHAPKSLKNAIKVFKNEQKQAKGVK